MFSGKGVPQYEINKQTLDTLYILMKRNQELDRLTEIIIADLEKKVEEYKAEGAK